MKKITKRVRFSGIEKKDTSSIINDDDDEWETDDEITKIFAGQVDDASGNNMDEPDASIHSNNESLDTSNELYSFIKSLDKKKRKQDDIKEESGLAKRKKRIEERTEPYFESEF